MAGRAQVFQAIDGLHAGCLSFKPGQQPAARRGFPAAPGRVFKRSVNRPDRESRVSTGPHRIVFANEKGGTGKSTTAVHVAVAWPIRARGSPRSISTTARPRSTAISRTATRPRGGGRSRCPTPPTWCSTTPPEALDALIADLSQDHDFLIFDTPGATIRWPAMSPPGPIPWSPRSTTASSIST
jgi:hypothetical protein